MKKKLNTVYFDIDDTLYSTTSFSEKARSNAVSSMVKAGLKISEEECLSELYAIIAEFPKNYEMHFDKLLARLGPTVYKGVNPNIIIAAGIVGYHETKHRELLIYEDVEDVLKLLNKTSLRLGIITSGLTMKQAEKIVRLGVNKYIDNSLIFITDERGYSKSNPKFYQLAVDAVQAPAREIMYVGDNPIADIEPSNEVGMVSVLMKRGGKYLNEESKTPPKYIVQNFWELWELLLHDYKFSIRK